MYWTCASVLGPQDLHIRCNHFSTITPIIYTRALIDNMQNMKSAFVILLKWSYTIPLIFRFPVNPVLALLLNFFKIILLQWKWVKNCRKGMKLIAGKNAVLLLKQGQITQIYWSFIEKYYLVLIYTILNFSNNSANNHLNRWFHQFLNYLYFYNKQQENNK